MALHRLVRSGRAFAVPVRVLLTGELMGRSLDVGRSTALAAGLDRFRTGEFVGRPLGVGCLAALARDQSLFFPIHRGKASLAPFRHDASPFDGKMSSIPLV
jgi:hypothetical protein